MGPVVVVIILPLPRLLVKEVDVVRDAILVQELIELLVVDAMRPFDLAVQMRCPWADVDMADVQGLQVPVEA
jgi:hypothetical protein